MSRIVLLLVPLLCLAGMAEARMYQWTDPDSGTVQMSGQPPSWYRASNVGPRVVVFDRGRLVDDTINTKSNSESNALRDAALLDLEYRKEKAAREQEERQAKLEEDAILKRRQEGQHLTPAVKEIMQDILNEEMRNAFQSVLSTWDTENPDAAKFAADSEQAAQQGLPAYSKSIVIE